MNEWFSELHAKFILDFVDGQRWMYITDGLKITLIVTALALIFGLLIGVLVAIVRTTYDQLREGQARGAGGVLLKVADTICRLYLTVIRGTPTLVQLLIWYFIILATCSSKIMVAAIAFSVNSGAYMAEIFRSGIMSVDSGQMEAGRSLGLGYGQTMLEVIMPQAVKNCLPSLGNEIITVLKETSICGYIGLNELTRGGDIIRGVTFDAFLPLIGVAVIYLAMVMVLERVMLVIERRLRQSDIR